MTAFALTLAAFAAPAAEKADYRDVVYCTAGAEKLCLDLTVPAGPGPFPVVVCFHGGAWKYGHRKDVSGWLPELSKQGIAAATVSYRLAPTHKWPAQIEDAKAAVGFLKANAAKYRLNPDRVAAMGYSAGGHLSALLGTADSSAGFEAAVPKGVDSKVACVVDFFGPADLMLFTETPGVEKAYFKPLFGKASSEVPEDFKNASPVNHVSKSAPPFLILHGTADVIVPVIHSERLHAKLKDAGADSTLITVPLAGHGWAGPESRKTDAAVLDFLRKQLKVQK